MSGPMWFKHVNSSAQRKTMFLRGHLAKVFLHLLVGQSLDHVVIDTAHEIIKLFKTSSKQKHENLVLSDVVCVLSELNIILISDVHFQILVLH